MNANPYFNKITQFDRCDKAIGLWGFEFPIEELPLNYARTPSTNSLETCGTNDINSNEAIPLNPNADEERRNSSDSETRVSSSLPNRRTLIRKFCDTLRTLINDNARRTNVGVPMYDSMWFKQKYNICPFVAKTIFKVDESIVQTW